MILPTVLLAVGFIMAMVYIGSSGRYWTWIGVVGIILMVAGGILGMYYTDEPPSEEAPSVEDIEKSLQDPPVEGDDVLPEDGIDATINNDPAIPDTTSPGTSPSQ